jgi:hypothetical protein
MSNYTIYHNQTVLWSTDDPQLAELYYEHCMDVYPEAHDSVYMTIPAGNEVAA